MKPPWTTQLASDIVRDGLGLELLDTPYRVVAEVFRCDADHTVTIRRSAVYFGAAAGFSGILTSSADQWRPLASLRAWRT